ncbi:MAG: molybdopterin-dependent oxidoreductase [Planctomycetes bacterium]|nr:molybdopterin-dependent oxidoreductase [Planctomycetota bacterium]
MTKFKVNGKEYDAPAGTNLLQFCLDHQIYIPHNCYHPALTVAGNCRMCMVKGKGLDLRPGVMTSCTLSVREPGPKQEMLEIETEAPEVIKAREGVLEFLLINHPLDCPVCDQAGECYLQDYSFTYGKDRSRFVEPKNIRHTKDVGDHVKIWGNRCIVCTRCVRFCEEVVGTGELAVVERGDRNVVDNFPGLPMSNLMSSNTVDICPVGALLDKEFLYQARVWFMETAESVCPSCSVGCNTKVDTYQGAVKRFRPRENQAVNQWWMCDIGRYNHKFTAAPDRLGLPKRRGTTAAGAVEWTRCSLDGALGDVRTALDRVVHAEGGAAVAGLASAWMSNEELWLFKGLMADMIGARDLGLLTAPDGVRTTFKKGFVIESDRNPNRRGAAEILGRAAAERGLATVLDGIHAGRIKAALVIGGIPEWAPPPELVAALRKLAFLAVVDVADSPLAALAHLVIPGATWVEKDGTFTNAQGRVQRFTRALAPPGVAAAETELLQRLAAASAAGAPDATGAKVLSAQSVFGDLAARVAAFAGLNYHDIGTQGKLLAGATGAAAAAPAGAAASGG